MEINKTDKPQISARELFEIYLEKNYNLLSEKFIAVLQYFEVMTYLQLDNQSLYFINYFLKTFLDLFTQPDYVLSTNHAILFIKLNPTIANLVAISSFKTTDVYLDILKSQPHNFAKLLALYSARNKLKLNPKVLFDTNAQLASLWYSYFCDLYRTGLVNKEVDRKLKEHLRYNDERLTEFDNLAGSYFGSTYIDGDRDKYIKQKINHSIKLPVQINNKPNRKKIAVISSLWYPEHPVYRTLYEFVDALKDDYELTLVHRGEIGKEIDIRPFKSIQYVDCNDNYFNLDSLRENNFMLVYYPDVGMTKESIILANLRIAPIQVCGVGHSVSTFGSEIDYYISGADVEILEAASENYSERLVLLPGLGIINNYPDYQLRDIKKQTSDFLINCAWSCHKINYEMVCILAKIVKQSNKKISFRIFGGGGESLLARNGFIPFAMDLESLVGKDNYTLIPGQSYKEYMALMEAGDICIDSFHFGGCNTIADGLYLRKPTVTFEGTKWYNRIGSQMLREVGLSELIATNREEYINLVVRLIDDDEYRGTIEHKLQQVDLERTIFSCDRKKYFKTAIDFLIENHQQLKQENSSKPIVIDK